MASESWIRSTTPARHHCPPGTCTVLPPFFLARKPSLKLAPCPPTPLFRSPAAVRRPRAAIDRHVYSLSWLGLPPPRLIEQPEEDRHERVPFLWTCPLADCPPGPSVPRRRQRDGTTTRSCFRRHGISVQCPVHHVFPAPKEHVCTKAVPCIR